VYENLRLARRRVTFEEVQQAARLAGIHDTIMALPQQYDTPLGEHGTRLSGGERQRLGIARLFIKNAPMAILDEPTANLDAVTERDVLTALAQHTSTRTVLHITHRLIGMERLDWILVLNHGVIAEQGAHSDLLGAGGLYRRLWNLQNRRASSTPVRLADVS
jgi:ABC-type multidrug transport system fused ATPase/permease subunit